jgi:uncharacterized membrane protein
VVIGAMLVSPLMGPIMAPGFGLATFDSLLLRRGLGTLALGILFALLLSALIVALSPVKAVTAEIAARTAPTLLDLAVAIVGRLALVGLPLSQGLSTILAKTRAEIYRARGAGRCGSPRWRASTRCAR